MKKTFKELAIPDADQLLFGKTPKPVKCGYHLNIGAGQVFPEINFTLPVIKIDSDSWSEIIRQYHEIAEVVVSRAVKLCLPGLVVEFEQLPPMTENPQWGAEITKILKDYRCI